MSEETKETKVQEEEDEGEAAGAKEVKQEQEPEETEHNAQPLLQGTNIAQVLKSTGPVVTCVLLKHIRHDGKDGKPHALSGHVDKQHQRQVFTELIEEVQVDTTPSKSGVQQVLGGPFTFLGQYPDEGVVVMARKELLSMTELEKESISSLRRQCLELQVDITGILEKNELISALLEAQLPINPHNLQPPLDGIVVRGDILIMKIAETDEVLDHDNTNDGDKEKTAAVGNNIMEMKVLSNEEFFLNYTKDEWVAFASRTDVKAPEEPESDNDDDDDNDEHEEEEEHEGGEGGDDDDDDNDDEEDDDGIDADFNLEEADEEDRHAMLNLVLGEVLRNFRHEHGRGPDTRELLELRSQIAKELHVEVTTAESLESSSSKRSAAEEALAEHHSPKKVKFSPEAISAASAAAAAAASGDDDDDDKKPAAKKDTTEENDHDGNEHPDDDDDNHKPAKAGKEDEKNKGPQSGEEES